MKKKLVVLLAAVMMLASTTTVLAAPSATSEAVEKVATVAELKAAVKGAESEAGEVKVAEVTDTTAVDKVDDAALAVVQKETADVKAKVLAMADLTIAGADLAAGVQIKVAVDGVYSTDTTSTIKALHWNGTEWENIKVVAVEKGAVTIEVTSLSPIAFVKVIPTADKFGVSTVLPLVAAAALAGTVATGKKINK